MAGGIASGPARPASDKRGAAATWRPLLTGALAGRARAALDDITAAVDAADPEPAPAGAPPGFAAVQQLNLGSGLAGIGLLQAEVAAANQDAAEAARARRSAGLCAAGLAEVTMGPALLGGFAGIAWALETIERRLGGDPGDLAAEIDEALATHVAASPWAGEYDLVSGLVGFAVYGLCRLPAPAAERLLCGALARLEELAVPVGRGVAWRTPPERLPPHQRAAYPSGCWNVGLAHGTPGVVAALAELVTAGIEPQRSAALLRQAAAWVLEQRLDGCPAFPSLVDASKAPDPSRLAWCYGDPGVALALLKAGAALEDGDLIAAALDIARSAARQPPERSGVFDAGLCHGAAGLAHIYNRFHQATADTELGEAARRWVEITLDLRREGEAVAGFPAWQMVPAPHWSPTPGLLNGAAGVGLMLSSALGDLEPAWDRCLLLDLPGAA